MIERGGENEIDDCRISLSWGRVGDDVQTYDHMDIHLHKAGVMGISKYNHIVIGFKPGIVRFKFHKFNRLVVIIAGTTIYNDKKLK